MQRNTGYFPTESLEPSGNRLFSRSALNEGDLFRGSLVRPNCPHYDGAGFIPDAYSVPEEELICWSETSLKGPLTAESFQRYMELFKQVLPEESRRLAL